MNDRHFTVLNESDGSALIPGFPRISCPMTRCFAVEVESYLSPRRHPCRSTIRQHDISPPNGIGIAIVHHRPRHLQKTCGKQHLWARTAPTHQVQGRVGERSHAEEMSRAKLGFALFQNHLLPHPAPSSHQGGVNLCPPPRIGERLRVLGL